MKKIFLFMAALAFSAQAWATYFNVGTLRYTIIDEGNKYVSVSQNTRNYPSGDIIIPEKVTSPNDNIEYTVTAISDDAFANSSSITSVEIPNGVKTIGDMAFFCCGSLTSVTIPNSVTTIGVGAFAVCYLMTSLTIPASVTSIGDNALGSCSSLSAINVDNSNPSFKSVDGVVYNKAQNTIVCCPAGITGDYTIPNNITTIGKGAFAGCSRLTSITIPESVTTIEGRAFDYCSGLTSITIPNSVTIIDSSAFSNCQNLESVTLSEGVTTICEAAFYQCGSLTSITIPASTTAISNKAFYDCINLSSINVNENNPNYASIDGVLFNKDKTTLIYYPKGKSNEYTIPNGVTTIGESAFEGSAFAGHENMTSVTIPNSVTNICKNAFYRCSGLTSITIPENVITIGDYAFGNCNGLTEVTIGNSVTSIGNEAFEGCSGLTSVTIPNSVTSIGNGTFAFCSNLKSITIPNSVTSIGDWAFNHCRELTSVTIPTNITAISNGMFEDCIKLASVNIHENVTSIGEWAFSGCSRLASIDIPASVTAIGERAFYECSSLTSVSIPANVTTINDYTFYGCNSLASAVMSEGVDSIGYFAFNGCSNLTSISLPNSVTHVGIYAFYGCNESAFTKENGLKYLGNSENEYHALVGAELDDLSSCTINSNCKIIAVRAFTNDRKMVSINIPKSVTNIGAEAFNNCSSLATINVENENAVYMSEDGVLFNKDKTILICYPGRKSGEYTIPDGVTTIEDNAFEYCYNLTSVIIPASVTTIGYYAFYDCGELTTIAISEGVTTIGEYAFGDYFLEDATIYCRVTEIPSGWNSKWNVNNYPVKLGCKILNVAANNAQYGTVSVAGYVAKSADGSLWYENNTEATLTATAQEGYHFAKWADNNDTNATRTFNVTDDATFTAVFEENTENGGNENQGGNNNNPATTVGESVANAVNIYAYGNTIVVENATDEIYVYNAMGGLVCRDAACHVSTMTINGPGVYIVRTGNVTKRVMVN